MDELCVNEQVSGCGEQQCHLMYVADRCFLKTPSDVVGAAYIATRLRIVLLSSYYFVDSTRQPWFSSMVSRFETLLTPLFCFNDAMQ